LDIEDELNSSFDDKDARKHMSSSNAKAFMSLRQRVKKHNKMFETELEYARNHPDSSSESDIVKVEHFEASEGDKLNANEIKFERSEKEGVLTLRTEKKDITYEMVEKKLSDLCALRGKKGTDREEFVDQLTLLSKVAKCAAQETEILINVISAQFDISGSMTSYMPVKVWNLCVKNVLGLLHLLVRNHHISLVDHREPLPQPRSDAIMEGSAVEYWCSLGAFIERLDDEYFKSLQAIDPHSKDYVLRLQDDQLFLSLMFEVCKYYDLKHDEKNLVKIFLRLLEHSYWKTEKLCNSNVSTGVQQMDKAQLEVEGSLCYLSLYGKPNELGNFIHKLATYIYRYGDERARTRSILCEVYQNAISGNFFKGRELLLLSHLQENIHHADVSTQILYNRASAQMGVCAFKKGMFIEAHGCLTELFTSGRVKELLAQGINISRFHERSLEQEKLERRRQMPFHLHINIEMLESIYMISSMIVEATNLTHNSGNSRSFGKPFSRFFDAYERQSFNGPPENIRDTIMCATNFLLTGEWRKAVNLVSNMNLWPSLGSEGESIRGKLVERMKEVSLEVYLVQFASEYSAVDLSTLIEMFNLSASTLKSISCRMISSEEIIGAFDGCTNSVTVGDHVDKSRLQFAATRLAEKVGTLLDSNDRALNHHLGPMGSSYQVEDDIGYRSRRGSPDDSSLGRKKIHFRVGKTAASSESLDRKMYRRNEVGNFKGKMNRKDDAFLRTGKLNQVERLEPISSDRMVALGTL
jgi:translation initiation factor 3 subunit C